MSNKEKSMTVSYKAIASEGLGEDFRKLRTKGTNVSEKMAKIILKIPGVALQIGANVGSAVAHRKPEASLATIPDVINFYHTSKGFHQGKFV